MNKRLRKKLLKKMDYKRFRKKQLEKITCYMNPRDIYNLDMTIAKFIFPRLRLFKKLEKSYPGDHGYSWEQWMADLDKMIAAFELIASDRYSSVDEEKGKIIEEGLDLFREQYFGLWL